MGDLLDDYTLNAAWDEMFDDIAVPRDAYSGLAEALQTLSHSELDERCALQGSAFLDQGITFGLNGQERPFPLDLIPRIITESEWTYVAEGIRQRIAALEAFLMDVYGRQEILADGVIPRQLVLTAPHYLRQAHRMATPNDVRIHVAGIDLVRDENGNFVVLEDNLRTPSGISYVLENRLAMTHVFPELFASQQIRSVNDYPTKLFNSLCASAPAGVDDPTVVVLTPGVHNSAYFEHAFLAREMGVDLVEGRDLICRENVLFMQTTEGERVVDVVYRRIDDEFLDPLHFRADSIIGCPGILNAARAGNVTIANAPGNGVADDKGVYPYVPLMIKYYLGENPILENVETYRGDDPDHLEYMLSHLDELVCKPVDASGGYGLVIGPQATRAQLEELSHRILSAPRRWIAQPVVTLSVAPTYLNGRIQPRHIDLRPFAVNDGKNIYVTPGGLTRVALEKGSLIVNSSQGGGSKDTWVLTNVSNGNPQKDAAKQLSMTPLLAREERLALGFVECQ